VIVARLFGVLLVIAAFAPLHRLLDPERAGPAGAATRDVAEAAWQSALYGTLSVLGLAFLLSRIVDGGRVASAMRQIVDRMVGPSPRAFAVGTGFANLALAAPVAFFVHGGMPTSVDEMATLLHAQALRATRLAWPLPGDPAAFLLQNGVMTPEGWASIYPPMHTLVLAIGASLGASWVVGPATLSVATGFATRWLEAVLGPRRGRAAGILLAVSPYWLLLGATHLSHTTAAAALAAAAWTALKAREGGVGWALATGAALGAGTAARPWVTLACGSAIVAAQWTGPRPRSWPRLAVRASLTLAGGLPFAALLLGWNARLFGSPWRLGYAAAFGPAHGLGFHRDPWGNAYGVLEAVAYTSADLLQLGARLLESPLPALAIVGLGLLIAPRLRGIAPLVAWSGAAVLANAVYWHHGVHFGPRMLFESTPAWIGLFVAGSAELMKRPWQRGLAAWTVALALAAAVVLGPGAVSRAGRPGVHPPTPVAAVQADGGRAVVFVHGSWASRVGARLAAEGMRRDSIETALRRNALCSVDRYARSHADGVALPPSDLDWEPRPGTPAGLEVRLLGPGNPARFDPAAEADAGCIREAGSDRFGVLDLEPLLWLYPPRQGAPTLVARDLGPVGNARVLEAVEGRAYVYVPASGPGPGALLEYDEGMELLWRGAAGTAGGS
jgi:hypothetical protein